MSNVRHHLLKIGPLSFYWIWINVGTEHQHRAWIACWQTPNNIIHLADPRWWRPIFLMPVAAWEAWRVRRSVR